MASGLGVVIGAPSPGGCPLSLERALVCGGDTDVTGVSVTCPLSPCQPQVCWDEGKSTTNSQDPTGLRLTREMRDLLANHKFVALRNQLQLTGSNRTSTDREVRQRGNGGQR